MNCGSFFAELKRRNVYKIAIAYIVAAWALAQGLAQVLPVFEIPNWTVRLSIVLLVLGFPVALLGAWAFEITPEGIKRTEDVDPRESVARHTGRKLVAITIGLAAVALAITLFRLPHAAESATYGTANVSNVSAKSIAVLPFQNLSDDKSNAYFADGIQDEILTRLSKVADLKVISHQSTVHYKSAPENLPEIAKQLGVTHVVEGSVQKSGDAVRINVQLVKAADDSHLWAETFDRTLTDIFSVESEVAKAIADQLQAKLTGFEAGVIAARPTSNTEAYDAYLRGLVYSLKSETIEARRYLKQAVELDPTFAIAWAQLSYVDSVGYRRIQLPRTEATREEARQAAERALTLQPNSGEAVFATGYYHYSCLSAYHVAMSYFEQARRLLPNSSLVPQSLALVSRRLGRWEQSESYFNEAEQLDPLNRDVLVNHVSNLGMMRRFPERRRKIAEGENIAPDDSYWRIAKVNMAHAEGDLRRAAELLASEDVKSQATSPFGVNAIITYTWQAVFEGRPAEAIPRLNEALAEPGPYLKDSADEGRFWLGWAQDRCGDHAAARHTWQQVVNNLEEQSKAEPENTVPVDYLALGYAYLGDKAAAFTCARRAMELVPIEKDLMSGPSELEIYARVAAVTGETEEAIAALKKLLSIPYEGGLSRAIPLTPALLRLDPMFDSLRTDQRFQKLCQEK